MDDAVKRLVQRHCATLKDEARSVGDALDSAALGSWSDHAEAAFRAAHTLKGSSGTLGFDEISAAALRLESALRPLRERAPAPDEAARVSAARGTLMELVERITPEQSRLMGGARSLASPAAEWGG